MTLATTSQFLRKSSGGLPRPDGLDGLDLQQGVVAVPRTQGAVLVLRLRYWCHWQAQGVAPWATRGHAQLLLRCALSCPFFLGNQRPVMLHPISNHLSSGR